MACKCREITTVIKCKSCGRIQTISHAKEDNILEKVKQENRQCSVCNKAEFEIT